MTPTPNPTAAASALCDEVIAVYEGNVGTHGPECYRWHAGCLALRVRQALAPQEPQALDPVKVAEVLSGGGSVALSLGVERRGNRTLAACSCC